ncbi:MAG: hemolysin family protein [Actinomycetota bacterium]|nr:hemolysin family protein [Actinomycetota bacterium]
MPLATATSHSFRPTDWAILAVIVVLVALSAMLALAETGLVRMSRAKAMSLQEEGRRGASHLVRMVERPERFLNPVLLLVLLCQLVAATLVGVVAEHLFGALGVAVATGFEVVVIFVVGEAAPKNWAVRHPDRAALLAAPAVSTIVAFPPIRWISSGLIALSNLLLPGKGFSGPYVSERELLAMADVAVQHDVIETEERALIQSIIDFGDTVVREVMVPRTDMVTTESRARVADVLEVAMAAGYSRIPVYGQNVDDVVGIVYTKDLMRADLANESDIAVSRLVRSAHFVPETKRVSELMREMQQQKYHMAIVVDEYGGTAGLVTLEDLIEELVGEIVDEFDVEEPLAEPLAGGGYRVNARMPLDEVNELLAADLPTGDWDTVGGLVYNVLGHVPTEGEAALTRSHRLIAEKVQGRRIGRVRIVPLPSEEAVGSGSAGPTGAAGQGQAISSSGDTEHHVARSETGPADSPAHLSTEPVPGPVPGERQGSGEGVPPYSTARRSRS